MQPDNKPQDKAGHGPWKVAHRGWHRVHVENTLEAFRAAYAAGCDMIEFDVQLSKDGVPFIFHDDDCRRLAGRRDRVYELEWKELQEITIPSAPGSAPITYRIPSLEEFLVEFGNRAFYLELKVPKAKADDSAYVNLLGEACARMVRAAGPDPRTFLGSFHGGILRHLAKADAFPLLAGIFESYERFREVHSGTDQETASAIRYYSVSWDIFRKCMRASGKKAPPYRADNMLIWDINGGKQFRKAMDSGVAGIVTDDVETLLSMGQKS